MWPFERRGRAPGGTQRPCGPVRTGSGTDRDRFDMLLRRAKYLLNREPWWAEVWAAIATLGWAMTSTTTASSQPQSFRVLVELADTSVWEATGFLLGSAQLLVLLTDSRPWRRLVCFLASWWWMMLLLALLLAVPGAPSLALYAVMAAVNLFSLVRLRREDD